MIMEWPPPTPRLLLLHAFFLAAVAWPLGTAAGVGGAGVGPGSNGASFGPRRLLQTGGGKEGGLFLFGHVQQTLSRQGRSHGRASISAHEPVPAPAPSTSFVSAAPEGSPSSSPHASPHRRSPSQHRPFTPPPHLATPRPTTTRQAALIDGSAETPAHSSHKLSGTTYGLVASGVVVSLLVLAAGVLCCRAKKMGTVKPWATGLSGQLQKAFVTGVPALKRSELEVACEDFSNIIGSTSSCMLYKGTLSSGVEIAVASSLATSAKDWSKDSEKQYRGKITSLSKVSHKNFMNLLGYCAEERPFTRVMVFEYAPNGTLFEHLHVREAEKPDWMTRLRICMGIAYCLEHMHQLKPPVVPRNFDSTTIYLTDDFAAKVSDLEFRSDANSTTADDLEDIVRKYGMVLLEVLTGRLPRSEEDVGSLEQLAHHYFDGEMRLAELIDPSMGSSFPEDAARALCEVVRSCIDPDPKKRPRMAEVAARMREITALGPDGTTPKVSPLWWAELEIMSSVSC